ncbi:uncharacterized protein KIAA2012 homolog isoform X2 [Cynoglossus semilaevis]|uniref:uncharacterized protein KIAA2012 homolog isoform X2 n=1 Tax=Cynoglossus semilaevis TaxID=244447 RepID=UPI000D6249CB|nr:uncharacterized protein KIAA2012 homolog isoform X2 [Cynoglossus semilaevis]
MDSGSALRGLGKQSSMAYLQNRLQDPRDAANRGVVKGLLPLELRDLQNSKPVGCLILGPDGEIIQLSLYDNNQERGQGDNDMPQQQALQVLSPEGETLPWVVMLQPEVTHDTEAEVEDNSDVMEEKTQHNQPMHAETESNTSADVFATTAQSMSDERPFHKTPAFSPTNHKGAGTQGRTEAEMQTRSTRKDVRNSIKMLELRDSVGNKESNRGKCEADEVKEGEEEDRETGESGHLTGSHQASLSRKNRQIKDTSPTVTETVEGKRTNIKRKDDEETAVTAGKKDLKMPKSRELEGQRSFRRDREAGRQQKKTESNSRPMRSRKSDERTRKDAGVSREGSALPAVASAENAARDRQGRIKEVKMNEEGDAGGGGGGAVAMLKEASAGRKKRRKGRLTQKDAVDENNELETNQKMEKDPLQKSSESFSLTQNDNCEIELNSEEDSEIDHLSNFDDRRSMRSVSSLRSSAAASQFNLRNTRRSATSSCEGTLVTGAVDLASSQGRLSSCSAVMVMDEQLMLNTKKAEMSSPRMNQEEIAALRRAHRAERRREEVERKRRDQEEEERKQQEREQMEEMMKNELQEERRKRADELRLKKLAEEEEKRRREEEEQARLKQEQAERESERRRQEDRRRQMARLKKLREEEDQRRKAEMERVRLEEQRRQEEENAMLQEMDEDERKSYLCRKEQEKEENRKREEEQKRREKEAALRAAEEAKMEAGRLLREMALLQQHLSFKRTFDLEAGGLEKTQGISRPWVFSYFSLLQLMGLSPSEAEPTI